MTKRDSSPNSIYWNVKTMYELTTEDVIGRHFTSLEENAYFYKKTLKKWVLVFAFMMGDVIQMVHP